MYCLSRSQTRVIQPQMGGRYEVNSRWMKTAAVASASEIPAAVRPRIRPASTTPMPPGDGETPPTIPATVITTIRVGSGRWSPKARSETDSTAATSSRWPHEPLASSTSLRGELTRCEVAQTSRTLGRTFSAARLGGGEPPAQPGDHADCDDDGQDDPYQFGVASRLRSDLELDETPRRTAASRETARDRDPADGAHDGARTQRHRGVVALSLVEAHAGGEDCRCSAGQ